MCVKKKFCRRMRIWGCDTSERAPRAHFCYRDHALFTIPLPVTDTKPQHTMSNRKAQVSKRPDQCHATTGRQCDPALGHAVRAKSRARQCHCGSENLCRVDGSRLCSSGRGFGVGFALLLARVTVSFSGRQRFAFLASGPNIRSDFRVNFRAAFA